MRQDHFVQGDGRITIGRITSNVGPEVIRFELDDALNHVRLVELEMSLVEFAAAITGAGWRECKFAFNSEAPLGKRLETKVEEIVVPRFEFDRNNPERVKAVRKAVAFFEGDGWMGDDRDASNHHNLVATNREQGIEVYRIRFHRYVEQEA